MYARQLILVSQSHFQHGNVCLRIEGMLDAAKGKLTAAQLSDPEIFKTKTKDDPTDGAVLELDDHNTMDSKYQYCTEAVVLLKDGTDKEAVLAAISSAAEQGLGDSIACVGAPAKVRYYTSAFISAQLHGINRPF